MLKLLPILITLFFSISLKGQTVIEPSDPNISYWGRVDFTNPNAIAFEFSGVTIRAKFSGTSISARINDFALHGPTTTNYFYKIIDGGTPQKFEALQGINSYLLAENLNDGPHTVQLIKLTEANVGKSAFMGFTLDAGASILPLTEEPACNIEFIGNSITCGYGNEISIPSNPDTGFHSENENNYKAWGYIAARNLGMKYSAVCYSGRGLYRNNTGNTTGTVPELYERIFPDNSTSPAWVHQSSPLNYIVVNLGTNDFAIDPATPLDQTLFESTYVKFIEKLKGYHPNATIILAVGVMMSNDYPTGAQHWTRIRTYVKNVVDAVSANGIKGVYYFEMAPQTAPYGEDWHPSAATHTRMATSLTTFVKSLEPACAGSVLSVKAKSLSNKSIKIHPNPTKNMLFLSYEGDEMEWTIYGSLGQKISSGTEKTIETSTIPSGSYFLTIENQTFKFLK